MKSKQKKNCVEIETLIEIYLTFFETSYYVDNKKNIQAMVILKNASYHGDGRFLVKSFKLLHHEYVQLIFCHIQYLHYCNIYFGK